MMRVLRPYLIQAAIFCCAIAPFAIAYLVRWATFATYDDWQPIKSYEENPYPLLLFVGIGLYAMYRVFAFHPFFRGEYRQWLRSTPWRSSQPLPLGPLHMTWFDVVLLAAAMPIGIFEPELHTIWVPVVFVGVYSLIMMHTFLDTGAKWCNYLIAIGYVLIANAARNPVALMAAVGVTYLAVHIGLRRSLAKFDEWSETVGMFPPDNKFALENRHRPIDRLGPHFDLLSVKQKHGEINYPDALVFSAWVGGTMYGFVRQIPVQRDLDVIALLAIVPFLSAVPVAVRLCWYCWKFRSPISLWGRLMTFRWIIPGYDKVFIAPICTLLVSVIAPLVMFSLWVPPAIVFGLSISLVVATATMVGPSLESWRLTGQHRITSGPFSAMFDSRMKL